MQTFKKINIFGSSERINDLDINKLFLEGPSIGVNKFTNFYKPTFKLFMDDKQCGNCVYKLNNKQEYEPYLKFTPNFLVEKDLFGIYTIATYAIDFAIKQGYNEAVLYGILDGEYKEVDENNVELYHFYGEPQIIRKELAKARKDAIFSYSEQIKLTIPYLTA